MRTSGQSLRRRQGPGVDLLVLGTHGRTGAQKYRLGSIAEEIFRRSPVPVLTIGPEVYGGHINAARFCRVLFATDFEAESDAAVPLQSRSRRKITANSFFCMSLMVRGPE